MYALEGSIAVTGSLIQWLRDNLELIKTRTGDRTARRHRRRQRRLLFRARRSPACSRPYWRGDARGVIVGLTRFINRGHIARAALEAAAYQSREVIEAMEADSGVELLALKVDGGMVVNELLMQFQSDILGVPVIRPQTIETTALGAAYAAGLAVGFWAGEDDIRRQLGRRPPLGTQQMIPKTRERLFRRWKKAVTRTFDWVKG